MRVVLTIQLTGFACLPFLPSRCFDGQHWKICGLQRNIHWKVRYTAELRQTTGKQVQFHAPVGAHHLLVSKALGRDNLELLYLVHHLAQRAPEVDSVRSLNRHRFEYVDPQSILFHSAHKNHFHRSGQHSGSSLELGTPASAFDSPCSPCIC